jgi:hypothetical protein
MNIEPDSIILPRLYPWLEKSRLRMMAFGLLVMVGLIALSFIWLTRFYSEFVVLNIYLAAILFLLFIIYIYSIIHEAKEEPAADFCPECGSLQIGSRYCPDCGRKNYF